MLFGPHDRLLLFQTFQTLLLPSFTSVKSQVWRSFFAWLLIYGLRALAVFGTLLVDTIFSWPVMGMVTVFAGQRLCPFADPPMERPPRYKGSPAAPLCLVAGFIWFPLLLELLQTAGWEWWFDSGYGFVALLISLQWWILGIVFALEKLRCLL